MERHPPALLSIVARASAAGLISLGGALLY